MVTSGGERTGYKFIFVPNFHELTALGPLSVFTEGKLRRDTRSDIHARLFFFLTFFPPPPLYFPRYILVPWKDRRPDESRLASFPSLFFSSSVFRGARIRGREKWRGYLKNPLEESTTRRGLERVDLRFIIPVPPGARFNSFPLCVQRLAPIRNAMLRIHYRGNESSWREVIMKTRE